MQNSYRIAAMQRWIEQIYNNRGALDTAQWLEFKTFCEQQNLTYQPPPGKRLDRRDPWSIREGELIEEYINAHSKS